MKGIYLLVAILFLSGCTALPPSIKYYFQNKSSPEVNKITSQELGDTLVSYLRATTALSYKRLIGTSYKNKPRQDNLILAPVTEWEKWDLFSDGVLLYCHDKVNDKWCYAAPLTPMCSAYKCAVGVPGMEKLRGKENYMPAIYVDITKPNFRQELIYNGKVGTHVKFLYRELSGPPISDAFTKEIQFDLDESQEIGFKGAKLEIIEATNRSITYKVTSHFDSVM